MTKITRHSASAALEMLPDGVLIVRLAGPLTGEALLHFKAQIVAMHGPSIRGYVADYTRATIALTGAELDAVLEGEPGGSAPAMPAALVVRAECLPLFAGHCIRMAATGRLRQVFTNSAAAASWAALEAGLHAAAPSFQRPPPQHQQRQPGRRPSNT